MSFLDKAKDLANEHADKIDDAVTKAAAIAKDKTGGKYDDKIDKVDQIVKDKTGNL